ncbi:MAG TPA: hypothetical protein VMX11_06065 [Actinomycetes bacterium]|nr:hypothetical protein [Actinomycetes bacterium]
MSSDSPLEVARRLARALDADDFAAARLLLHSAITYRIGADEHRGPDDVLRSYSEGSARARSLFDRVDFDHTVIGLVNDQTVRVDFSDRLEVAEDVLVHHSVQDIEVGPDSTVISIVDRPVVGQRERIDAFLISHGLARPPANAPKI